MPLAHIIKAVIELLVCAHREHFVALKLFGGIVSKCICWHRPAVKNFEFVELIYCLFEIYIAIIFLHNQFKTFSVHRALKHT